MASTVVGAITHALGVTLPFAFYTSMSSTISVAIGPLGWGLLAAWGVHKIGAPNEEKTVPAVLLVAAVRQRLIYQQKRSLEEVDSTLQRLKGEMSALERELQHVNEEIRRLGPPQVD